MVHRSSLDPYANELIVQTLRKQLGQYVYPVHRLDRKTSGILVLALSKEIQTILNRQFQQQVVQKEYVAIVRGHTPKKMEIDYPLKHPDRGVQEAYTSVRTIESTLAPWPSHIYETSRYSLVELVPKTGRMHQLRKHMAHVFHPIIGDRPHGCNKQNRMLKEKFDLREMLLHARVLQFEHPISKELLSISASLPKYFIDMAESMLFTKIREL